MHEEIERKFLVAKLPEGLDRYPHSEIKQGYLLSCDPEFLEERLRTKGGRYFMTIKLGKGAIRSETEMEICNSFLVAKFVHDC